MKKMINYSIASVLIMGAIGSNFLFYHPSHAMESELLKPFIDQQDNGALNFYEKIIQQTIEKTIHYKEKMQHAFSHKAYGNASWSDTIKKVINHHNDPRIHALVVSLVIISIGGTYLTCRKNSSTHEKVLGLCLILFSVTNIICSSYWIHLLDRHINLQ
jgi:hypothetical protein